MQLTSKYRIWGSMRCQEVDDVLLDLHRNAESVIPIDVARHISRCDACRAFYRGLRGAVYATPVPASLSFRILSAIRNSRAASLSSQRDLKK